MWIYPFTYSYHSFIIRLYNCFTFNDWFASASIIYFFLSLIFLFIYCPLSEFIISRYPHNMLFRSPIILVSLSRRLMIRGEFTSDATSKMEVEAVNYYHKAFRLGCCSSLRSASDDSNNAPLMNCFVTLINFIYITVISIVKEFWNWTKNDYQF